jgi:hypothetical protein
MATPTNTHVIDGQVAVDGSNKKVIKTTAGIDFFNINLSVHAFGVDRPTASTKVAYLRQTHLDAYQIRHGHTAYSAPPTNSNIKIGSASGTYQLLSPKPDIPAEVNASHEHNRLAWHPPADYDPTTIEGLAHAKKANAIF